MKLSHLIMCCLASAVLWGGIGASVGVVLGSSEDDTLANCHIYGNGECGPDAPWHGFVNLF